MVVFFFIYFFVVKRTRFCKGDAAAPQRDWLLLEAHNDGSAKSLTHGDALIEFRARGALKYLLLGPEDPAVEDGWWPPDGEDVARADFLVRCSWHGGGPRSGAASMPNLCTQTACLFNLSADPCEYDDVAAAHPDVVAALRARLATFAAVPPESGSGCLPRVVQVLCSDGVGTCPAYQPCDAPPLPPPLLAGAPLLW